MAGVLYYLGNCARKEVCAVKYRCVSFQIFSVCSWLKCVWKSTESMWSAMIHYITQMQWKCIKYYFIIYLIWALRAIRASLKSWLQVPIIFYSPSCPHHKSELPWSQLCSCWPFHCLLHTTYIRIFSHTWRNGNSCQLENQPQSSERAPRFLFSV